MQRLSGDRTDLRLEQGGKEEWVIPQFDRFNTGVVSTSGNDKAMLGESISVSGRQPVVAPVEAHKWLTAAEIVHSCPRYRNDVALLTDKAAGEAADYEIAAVRRCLGMVSICDPGDVSRELYDGVLETGAGAKNGCPAVRADLIAEYTAASCR
jgi:hypothetical protein